MRRMSPTRPNRCPRRYSSLSLCLTTVFIAASALRSTSSSNQNENSAHRKRSRANWPRLFWSVLNSEIPRTSMRSRFCRLLHSAIVVTEGAPSSGPPLPRIEIEFEAGRLVQISQQKTTVSQTTEINGICASAPAHVFLSPPPMQVGLRQFPVNNSLRHFRSRHLSKRSKNNRRSGALVQTVSRANLDVKATVIRQVVHSTPIADAMPHSFEVGLPPPRDERQNH